MFGFLKTYQLVNGTSIQIIPNAEPAPSGKSVKTEGIIVGEQKYMTIKPSVWSQCSKSRPLDIEVDLKSIWIQSGRQAKNNRYCPLSILQIKISGLLESYTSLWSEETLACNLQVTFKLWTSESEAEERATKLCVISLNIQRADGVIAVWRMCAARRKAATRSLKWNDVLDAFNLFVSICLLLSNIRTTSKEHYTKISSIRRRTAYLIWKCWSLLKHWYPFVWLVMAAESHRSV